MINKNNLKEVNLGLAVRLIPYYNMLLLSLGRQMGFYPKTIMTMENSYIIYSSSFLGPIFGIIKTSRIGFIIGYLLIKAYKTLENRN